jgi:electron transport complex protein RnfB
VTKHSAAAPPSESGVPRDYVERIHAALPQTQCMRCGYQDCRAYAQAMAEGSAAINRCPPGGAEGILRLASITSHAPADLDAECGTETARSVARIDDAWCIGCTLCIDACPTDAILGANKRMHTVISQHCTGCELCIPVCPVDCIGLDLVSDQRTGWNAWSTAEATNALQRYERHQIRQQLSLEEEVPKALSSHNRRPTEMSASASETYPVAVAIPMAQSCEPQLQKLAASRRQALVEAAQKRARERQSTPNHDGTH